MPDAASMICPNERCPNHDGVDAPTERHWDSVLKRELHGVRWPNDVCTECGSDLRHASEYRVDHALAQIQVRDAEALAVFVRARVAIGDHNMRQALARVQDAIEAAIDAITEEVPA